MGEGDAVGLRSDGRAATGFGAGFFAMLGAGATGRCAWMGSVTLRVSALLGVAGLAVTFWTATFFDVTFLAARFFGATFVALHTREWFHLISEGLTPTSNHWGSPLFGAVFFGVTGLHMTHVVIGVIYLGIVAVGYGRGKYSAEDVEVNGLYWHFVDLVWMFVFPLIYLMSVKY